MRIDRILQGKLAWRYIETTGPYGKSGVKGSLILIKELVSMNNDLLKQLPILFAKGEAYPQMLRRRFGELPAFAGACEEADL